MDQPEGDGSVVTVSAECTSRLLKKFPLPVREARGEGLGARKLGKYLFIPSSQALSQREREFSASCKRISAS
jgi:hypothetical protein